MRKKFALLFVTVCAVMLSGCTLTGMTDVEKMYDDTERVTSGHTAYVATDWALLVLRRLSHLPYPMKTPKSKFWRNFSVMKGNASSCL